MQETIDPILLRAAAKLNEGLDRGAIDELALSLAPLHDKAKSEGRLEDFRRTCQQHPFAQIILQDPYSRRAFEKPRGYAGDAVMLDYIYKPGKIEASPVGTMIHKEITSLPNAQSILWRREYLADRICNELKRKPSPRILSVASGHMRELDLVGEKTTSRDINIWALDQDEHSLDECLKSYANFNIRPINKSISFLFKRTALSADQFDFIYSAGLADYLSDKILVALIRKLFRCLGAGGVLSIANFTPDSHGRAFMEGFMNWSLLYRDEADLVRIVEEAVPLAAYKVFRDTPQNVAYVEIKA